MIFAFVVLSFILFALCGFFAYQYGKRELTISQKTFQSRQYRKDRERAKIIQGLRADVEHLTDIVRQMPGNKSLVMPGMNVKDNMEERYARENPKVVAVDDVLKVVSG